MPRIFNNSVAYSAENANAKYTQTENKVVLIIARCYVVARVATLKNIES